MSYTVNDFLNEAALRAEQSPTADPGTIELSFDQYMQLRRDPEILRYCPYEGDQGHVKRLAGVNFTVQI